MTYDIIAIIGTSDDHSVISLVGWPKLVKFFIFLPINTTYYPSTQDIASGLTYELPSMVTLALSPTIDVSAFSSAESNDNT